LLENEIHGPVGSEVYREYHQIIRNSADHLLELVEEILDLSRLEAEHFRMNFAVYDPIAHTEEVIRSFHPIVEAKDVTIAFSHSENMPATILADRKVATQIQGNLISNAVRHAPDGSVVEVRWSLSDDDKLTFAVKDVGEGFSETVLKNYGQPFIVATPQHALGARRGFGLGLYICKRYIEARGGRFLISNNPEGGALAVAEWPAGLLQAPAPE
jgi:two-component system cell cycle sensor histidine kinase PleC